MDTAIGLMAKAKELFSDIYKGIHNYYIDHFKKDKFQLTIIYGGQRTRTIVLKCTKCVAWRKAQDLSLHRTINQVIVYHIIRENALWSRVFSASDRIQEFNETT